MPVYLDYNATAPLRTEAVAAMQAAFEMTGNPSSVHQFGRNVRKQVETAREQIAALVDADPLHVVFTSGATEANNWIIRQLNVTRVLVAATEHPSVLDATAQTNDHFVLSVLSNGLIDLSVLEQELSRATAPVLVSIAMANNETGIIQPMQDIIALCRKYKAFVYSDVVQGAGRIPLSMREMDLDAISLSAHKLGGPSGVGALIVRPDLPLGKLLHGGGQERRLRAGTENTIGIIGFGAAAKAAQQDRDLYARLQTWRDEMEAKMLQAAPQAIIVGKDMLRLGNTTQIILPGMKSETQLMALDLAGIAVSSGSACSSGSVRPSHVLLGMGIAPELATCALRISTGWKTTKDELDRFFAAWVANVQRIATP